MAVVVHHAAVVVVVVGGGGGGFCRGRQRRCRRGHCLLHLLLPIAASVLSSAYGSGLVHLAGGQPLSVRRPRPDPHLG